MNDFKTWPKLLWVTLIFCLATAGLSASDEVPVGVDAPGSAAAAGDEIISKQTADLKQAKTIVEKLIKAGRLKVFNLCAVMSALELWQNDDSLHKPEGLAQWIRLWGRIQELAACKDQVKKELNEFLKTKSRAPALQLSSSACAAAQLLASSDAADPYAADAGGSARQSALPESEPVVVGDDASSGPGVPPQEPPQQPVSSQTSASAEEKSKPKTLLDQLKLMAESIPATDQTAVARQVLLRAQKVVMRDYQDDSVRCGLGGFFSLGPDAKCTKKVFGTELFSLREQVIQSCRFSGCQNDEKGWDLSGKLDAVARLAVAEYVLFTMAEKPLIKKHEKPKVVAPWEHAGKDVVVGLPTASGSAGTKKRILRRAWFLIAEYVKAQLPETVTAHDELAINFADYIKAAVTKYDDEIDVSRAADSKYPFSDSFFAEVAKDPLYIPRGVFVFTATPGRKFATGVAVLAIVSAAVGFKKLFERYKKWRKKHRKASFWQFVKTLKPKFPKLKQRAKKTSGAKQLEKKPVSKKELDLLRNLGLSS